jgi:hypothetical protein
MAREAKALSLGELADQIFDKGLEIDKAKAALKTLEDEEAGMLKQLHIRMDEQKTDIVRGQRGVGYLSKYSAYKFDDLDEAFRWIRRTNNLQVFHRRLGTEAVKALIESRGGKPIPGISLFEEDRPHVRKRGAKE